MGLDLTDDEKRAFFGEHILYRKRSVEIAIETADVIQALQEEKPGERIGGFNLGRLKFQFLSNNPQTYRNDFGIVSNPITEYGLIAARQLAEFFGLKKTNNKKDGTGQEPLKVDFAKMRDSDIKLTDLLDISEPDLNDYREITQTTKGTFDIPLSNMIIHANEASAHLTVNTHRQKLNRPLNQLIPALDVIIKLVNHYIFFTYSFRNISDNNLIIEEKTEVPFRLQINGSVRVGKDNYIIRNFQSVHTYKTDVFIELLS